MNPDPTNDLSSLYRTYRPALIAFFTRRLYDRAEAEDMTQEVFARISGHAPADVRTVSAYMFQIAANLLRDRSRRDKVRDTFAADHRLAEGSGVETLDPHRVAAGREMLALLLEGLAELPERSRQIFLLYRYERIDQRTIAESFGISVSAVEKHIYKAMAKLLAKTETKR